MTTTVVLMDAAGEVTRLLQAVAEIDDADLPRHVVVGGLAVMARLAQSHRVTTDIDQAVRADDPDLPARLLLAHRPGAARSGNGVSLAGGTQVDLITIGVLGEQALQDLPEEPGPRAFVLAHDYAIETATPVTLQARRARDRTELVKVTALVATPAALVACKAQAPLTRRGATAAGKRGSDLLDLFRLLEAHDATGAVSSALARAPYGLGALTAGHLQALLVDGADRGARDLRALGTSALGIDAAALERTGRRIVAHLR